jgi:hypothetical protein
LPRLLARDRPQRRGRAAGEAARLGSGDRLRLDREGQEQLERGQQLGRDPGGTRVRLGADPLRPQPAAPRAEPGAAPVQVRGEPAQVGRRGLGVEPRRRVPLARGELGGIDLALADLDDQVARADAVPRRHVLAGGQEQPARGLGRAQGAVGAHPLPAAVVALGAHQSARLGVAAPYLLLLPPGAKSSTTRSASLAAKPCASRLLPVEDQLPGRCRASMPPPKCCCAKAASSVLNTPVGPTKWTPKSAGPRTERHAAA